VLLGLNYDIGIGGCISSILFAFGSLLSAPMVGWICDTRHDHKPMLCQRFPVYAWGIALSAWFAVPSRVPFPSLSVTSRLRIPYP